ncbi:MAG: hypothetical protein DMG32_18785 [Acidobacteria bacterium]|nr:MAG: hypothetical protein DMG32_18785 [Acidobacteriota bacterium]
MPGHHRCIFAERFSPGCQRDARRLPRAGATSGSGRETRQQRHIVLRKDLAGISKAERAAKTPAEIAKRLPTAFPPLPRPVWASLAPRASDAPEAPAIITVPQEDLKPLFDRLEDCRTCQEQQTRQASGVRSPQFWRPDKTRQASGVSISPTVILRGLCWMTLSSC